MGLAVTLSFVGRADERALLDAALADAENGRTRVFLVTGEPGIGKTALTDELSRAAEARGARVAFGRAWEGAGAPPFWLWTEALRSIGEPLTLPRTLGTEEARFACLEEIAERVRARAMQHTLVLVLDDLQWADTSSLLAAKLVARSLRNAKLLLLGTLRDPDESSANARPILAELRREATCVRLGGLSLADVTTLADARGVPATGAEVALRLTGGNALFAREMLEDASARAALLEGREPPIPHGVRHILARHFEELPEGARATLEWAAIAGEPIDAAAIARASSVPNERVLAHLEAARTRGVIAAKLDRFAHDLFRTAAYEGIPAERRAAMHAALAGVVTDKVRIAHHLLLADPATTDEDVAAAVRAAAQEAITKLAYEEGVSFAEHAVRIHERAGRTTALADALTLLAEAKMRAGHPAESFEIAERAVAAARESADARTYARAALAYGLRRMMVLSTAPLITQLDEALRRLDEAKDDDVALRCAVEARLAAALQPMADPDRALALAHVAIERARATKDRALLARTLEGARGAFRMLDPRELRHGLDREALMLAELLGDENLQAHAQGRAFWNALEIGDALSADVALAAYERLAQKLRLANHQLGSACARIVRLAMTGNWPEAAERIDRLEATRDRWISSSSTHFGMDPVNVTRCMGPLTPEMARKLTMKVPPPFAHVFCVFAFTRAGLLAEATEPYEMVMAKVIAKELPWVMPNGDVGMAIRQFFGDATIRMKRADHASRLYDWLEPYEGAHVVGVPVPFYDGAINRMLAGLAALKNDRQRAERHYERALVEEEEIGAKPFVVRTKREREDLLGKKIVSTARAARPELVNEGDTWRVRFGDEEARVKDADGLRYIAYLLERPDVPVPVTELFGARAGATEEAPRSGDAGEVLDRDAIEAYRARSRDLRETLEEATARSDRGAAEIARRELAFIEEELRAAVGLGGRSRRAASEVERIRVNVTTRIKKTIDRLRERAPSLSHHLATTIKTGTLCTYRSPP